MAATPHRARLATACAGQRGVHAATPGQPASESNRVPLGRPLAGIGSGDGAGVRPTMVRPVIRICPIDRAACGGAAAGVAVEQARGDGHPCRVDPAHGRNHGRDGDRSDRSSRGTRTHVVPCGQHAVNPRLPGVVFEPAGIGGHHPMRDPGPRQDVAVIVGRDRLHRGRTDVDPDRHVAHAPSHGHLLQPALTAHRKLRRQGPRCAAGAQPAPARPRLRPRDAPKTAPRRLPSPRRTLAHQRAAAASRGGSDHPTAPADPRCWALASAREPTSGVGYCAAAGQRP